MTVGDLFYVIFFLVWLAMSIRGAYIFFKQDSTKDTSFDVLCAVMFLMSAVVLFITIVVVIIQYAFAPLAQMIKEAWNYKIF